MKWQKPAIKRASVVGGYGELFYAVEGLAEFGGKGSGCAFGSNHFLAESDDLLTAV